MRAPHNEEEARANRKRVAAELLGSCGLDKEIIQKRLGQTGEEKKSFLLDFKPSSETQPGATPFVLPDKKVPRDGMGVPPPKDGGVEF